MYRLKDGKTGKGLKIVGYTIAILVALSMLVLYFPVWR